jgi:thymidylate synthase (FAD)
MKDKVMDKKKDLGFIELIDKMGSAISVVNAARVSFGKKHTGPLREAPIFVMRQWQKHQVGSSFNEISGRYVEYDYSIYSPDDFRAVPSDNIKQGSGEILEDSSIASLYALACEMSYSTYKELLDKGVCREQARMILPLALFTECYWTCSLQAVVHFLKLRLAHDAQSEIRYYAEAVKEVLDRDDDMRFILDVCLDED